MGKRISAIIPVHNGGRWIKRTVRTVLTQQYDDFELILVENGSSDDSWALCEALGRSDNRVKAIQSREKGTSLARKKGIELASGDYIVCLDQDDRYLDRNALASMVSAAEKDAADITQFAFVKTRHGFRKKENLPVDHAVWDREAFLKDEICGVMGIHRGCFNTTVWNKIYRSDVLKEAVTHIREELYYAEDENLNIWAFISPYTKRVSAINEAFYLWNAEVGFSSKNSSGKRLLEDYETVKKNTNYVIQTYCASSGELLWDIHAESLYCMRAVAMELIREQRGSKEEVVKAIDVFRQYGFINEAKKFFCEYEGERTVWEDLRFLASDYSAEEFYEYCARENRRQAGMKSLFKKVLSKISR